MSAYQIVYEKGDYYVARAAKGYSVYRNGPVAAVRCAVIGYEGAKGLGRAIAEIERRMANGVPR